MKLIIRLIIALFLAVILTALTILSLGYINWIFVGEIPVNYTIIATVVTFLLYAAVTCFIAYLHQ